MKSRILYSIIACFTACSTLSAADTNLGIVNLNTCLLESKYGKQEQAVLENMGKQAETLMKDVESQLQTLSDKFNDPDYMDSLSPEKEKELTEQAQALSQEKQRYQGQYYQMLQQGKYRLFQVMQQHVGAASKTVAEKQNLSLVLNQEIAFYATPQADVTQAVIKQMDMNFDKANAATEKKPEDATQGK